MNAILDVDDIGMAPPPRGWRHRNRHLGRNSDAPTTTSSSGVHVHVDVKVNDQISAFP